MVLVSHILIILSFPKNQRASPTSRQQHVLARVDIHAEDLVVVPIRVFLLAVGQRNLLPGLLVPLDDASVLGRCEEPSSVVVQLEASDALLVPFVDLRSELRAVLFVVLDYSVGEILKDKILRLEQSIVELLRDEVSGVVLDQQRRLIPLLLRLFELLLRLLDLQLLQDLLRHSVALLVDRFWTLGLEGTVLLLFGEE